MISREHGKIVNWLKEMKPKMSKNTWVLWGNKITTWLRIITASLIQTKKAILILVNYQNLLSRLI